MTASESTTTILLATGNPAKQRALRNLLEGLPLKPVTPDYLGLSADPEETAETHEAIAVEKVAEWSRLAGMLAIASDGGLVVPSLGANWESRYTHRFAGPSADDDERRRRLLQLLENADGGQREAIWVEALAIAESGRPLKSWALTGGQGLVAREAEPGPHGPGFWVFPLWYFPQFSKYYNQLSDGEKESLGDHWARLKGLVQEYFVKEFSCPSN
ncbi:MAG: hypothetical protein OXR67_02750 [Chloroflexota bacterium]|nr:hypothetical protein [Chloroflexota bacterium]